jgi:hypothetical protein
LPAQPRPVRSIYFDKTPETNWMVAWHQDLTLSVRDRIDVAGFGPWSVEGRRAARPTSYRIARKNADPPATPGRLRRGKRRSVRHPRNPPIRAALC